MKQQFNNRIVLPGEVIDHPEMKVNSQTFFEQSGQVKSLYFGLLTSHDIGSHTYLDISKKVTTYLPDKNHFVVGIIKAKMAQNFIIDINAPTEATLGGLDFDGASKRNKPNLSSGDIVFARVVDHSKFIGSKLSCLNAGYSAAKVLGELKGGMIVYGLRGKEKSVQEKIQILKNYCKFEVAFGKNDILWFSSSSPNSEMVLYNIFCEVVRGCSEQLFQSLLKTLKT